MSELKGRLSGGGALTGKIGSSAGGTSDHRFLLNRDAEDQHPIESISKLKEELERIPPPTEAITNSEIEEILK